MTKYGIDPKVICQIIDLANRHHIKTVILFAHERTSAAQAILI